VLARSNVPAFFFDEKFGAIQILLENWRSVDAASLIQKVHVKALLDR
jgi:hypothetical protein